MRLCHDVEISSYVVLLLLLLLLLLLRDSAKGEGGVVGTVMWVCASLGYKACCCVTD